MIPVYINNRNRLTTTRAMVEYLANVPGAYPVIIDNDSTYPPLLEWYKTYQGSIILPKENLGPWAAWKLGIDLALDSDYYVVTDSDLDLSAVPTDLLERLQSGLERFPKVIKAGLSLEIDDVPREIAEQVHDWEHTYWQRRLSAEWWDAPIDTTFAMYRKGWSRATQCTAPAIRADHPYVARHIPWYRILDDEERYVEAHCKTEWSSTVAHWTKPQA